MIVDSKPLLLLLQSLRAVETLAGRGQSRAGRMPPEQTLLCKFTFQAAPLPSYLDIFDSLTPHWGCPPTADSSQMFIAYSWHPETPV